MIWSYPFAHNIVLSFLVAAILAIAAYRLKTITMNGAIAGVLVATAMLFAGGIPFFVLLFVFVATGGLLSRLPNRNTSASADQHDSRTAVQILATTGCAGFAALLLPMPGFSDPMWQRALLAIIIATLATSFSDTLSAEFGSRYGGSPRKLLFGKIVEPGISGGVTLFGLAVGGVTALLFCRLATAMQILPSGSEGTLSLLAFLGNILDSIIGGTIQANYRCTQCGLIGEKKIHCGTNGDRVRGLPITNAGVNAICTIIIAVAVIMLYL